MTHKDEDYLFDTLEQIRDETHENKVMLKQICKFINRYLANHHNENEYDFNRNILANMISNIMNLYR